MCTTLSHEVAKLVEYPLERKLFVRFRSVKLSSFKAVRFGRATALPGKCAFGSQIRLGKEVGILQILCRPETDYVADAWMGFDFEMRANRYAEGKWSISARFVCKLFSATRGIVSWFRLQVNLARMINLHWSSLRVLTPRSTSTHEHQ